MLIFYTEEECEKKINEAKNKGAVEALHKIIEMLDNEYEHLKFQDKEEQAEGVKLAIEKISLTVPSYIDIEIKKS